LGQADLEARSKVMWFPLSVQVVLVNKDRRIRGLALKRLSEEGKQKVLDSLREELGALLEDPDMGIKEAALKIIRRRKWV